MNSFPCFYSLDKSNHGQSQSPDLFRALRNMELSGEVLAGYLCELFDVAVDVKRVSLFRRIRR